MATHPTTHRISIRHWVAGILACTIIPSWGTSVRAEPYTFTPPGCEFTMVFPEQPTTAQRCNPNEPDQCTDSSVFAQVYDIHSSMRVTVTCTPAEENMLQRYSGDVMRFTLESMARGKVENYETGFNDFGTAKQALLLGGGPNDQGDENVYMAQLWIGQKSVLTVEGVLTGTQTEDSDSTFAEIMKSIKVADLAQPAANKE